MTEHTTAPSPFPFEGPDYEIPRTRPPRRRTEHDDEPTPPPYTPGDKIMRCVLAAWLACAVVALLAGIGYHEQSGPWITAAFTGFLASSATGWAAYARADRKAVQS